MQSSDLPSRFSTFWGNAAGVGYIRNIPTLSQIGVEAGAASLTDGFPPDCFTPVGAGGTPPFGKDFNGILRWVTQWLRWQSAGGLVTYDATFATATGGYPKGAIVLSSDLSGRINFSTADNNTSDPDGATPTNWMSGDLITGLDSTGEFRWRPTEETLPGWVKANKLTIGNASSNATGRANADAYRLFKWHWSNFSNTQCQVYTSAGAPTTRGASADADWSANKSIETVDMRGTNPIGMDTMGGAATTRLASVPAVSGSAAVAGSVLGENLHTLLQAETPSHSHSGTTASGGVDHTHQTTVLQYQPACAAGGGAIVGYGAPFAQAYTSGGASAYLHTHTFSTSTVGSDGAHNNVSRVMAGTWYIKL